MGYSRKNPSRGKEIEDMEFPGVLKKKHVKISGPIKKQVVFP